MSFLNDALLLGQKLRETVEYREMKQAEILMAKDPEARKLYKDYQNLQNAYRRMEQMGKQLTQENIKALLGMEQSMLKNPHVKSYTEKKDRFMQILKQVDQKIGEGLSGPKQESCNTHT